jgi:CBS domain-containing protein/uncharacterized protein YrrD
MLYLSSYLGRPVLDAANRAVGTIDDLIARLDGAYPSVVGIRIRTSRHGHLDVAWKDVRSFETSQVILAQPLHVLEPYALDESDALLARNVLDKQIVDLEGRRLIRVQDIQLFRTRRTLRVLGVDVSGSALARRMRMRGLADRIARRYPPKAVAWDDVDLGSWRDPNVKLRVARSGLKRLHPADLAEIAADLPTGEQVELMSSLEDEVVADAIEEMDPDMQVRMLEAMGPDRAIRVLEEMSPDDAADLLQDMTPAQAHGLLSRMDPEEAREVQKLLGYEEESAGGLMTTDLFTARAHETTRQLIARLRAETDEDHEQANSIYVVDDEEHLRGVVSPWDLLVADPDVDIETLMDDDPISVQAGADQDEVVDSIAKYNLYALPVVDEEEHLLGVITMDDVIDIVNPKASERRRFLRG